MGTQLAHDTVPVRSLDEQTRSRMLSLMRRCYEGVTPERFFADLDDKQFVILLTDKGSRALAGFSTIALREVADRGRTAEVLFSGDTVILPEYWGQKVLDTAFSRFLLMRKLRRPFSPFYWLLLSAGYKTYLIILRYFAGAFPRRGASPRAGDVAFVQDICQRWFGPQYDPSRGVVRMSGHYRVADGIAPLDAQALADPDIAFFATKNPGHVNGDELVCLARVELWELGVAFLRILRKRIRRIFGKRPVRSTAPASAGTTRQPAALRSTPPEGPRPDERAPGSHHDGVLNRQERAEVASADIATSVPPLAPARSTTRVERR